jgi:hypothetical protein
MPAVLKILIVFVAVLALSRLRAQLGIALVLGGIALDAWAGAAPREILRHAAGVIRSPEWFLLPILAGIIEIGRFLSEKRNSDEIVGAVGKWGGRHGRTWTLTALPAAIGLIPMPAGAVFSAPFVEQAAGETEPHWKSGVNYWFRHVWEYWWPLYPGVIVTLAVFQMDFRSLFVFEAPYSVAAIAAGYVFLIRPHVTRLAGVHGIENPRRGRVAFLFLPILVVVVSLFLLPGILQPLMPNANPQVPKMLGMILGVAGALLVILGDSLRNGTVKMFSTLLNPTSRSIFFSLAGVVVFKSMLDASGLLPLASRELLAGGIPPTLAVAVLPLLAGLVTGVAFGFAGTAFPMVVGLLNAPGSGMTPGATLVLAYGFGYLGMMLSPVHLCLLATKDYFSSTILDTFRHIRPCVLAILLVCLALHLLLARMGW